MPYISNYHRRAQALHERAARELKPESRDAFHAAARTWELLADSAARQKREVLFPVLAEFGRATNTSA